MKEDAKVSQCFEARRSKRTRACRTRGFAGACSLGRHEICLLSDAAAPPGALRRPRRVLALSPTPLFSSVWFMSNARWLNHYLQPYNWVTGKKGERQPDDVPELHDAFMDVATSGHAPKGWIDIVRRRRTLQQHLPRDPLRRLQQATPLLSLLVSLPDVPFSVTSAASHIGMAAQAVSALLWCSFTQQSSP